MATSKLNYTFNAEEVVDKLRPYVTEVNNITLLLTFKLNMLSTL